MCSPPGQEAHFGIQSSFRTASMSAVIRDMVLKFFSASTPFIHPKTTHRQCGHHTPPLRARANTCISVCVVDTNTHACMHVSSPYASWDTRCIQHFKALFDTASLHAYIRRCLCPRHRHLCMCSHVPAVAAGGAHTGGVLF